MLLSVRSELAKAAKWDDRFAQAYCNCWQNKDCACGEDYDVIEWSWEKKNDSCYARISEDRKIIWFHPQRSAGTAVVKGDTPLLHNHHYYWEIKIMSETFGTDVMVGVGSDKMDATNSQKFLSFLGNDKQSYGLSYKGALHHEGKVCIETQGFCGGALVGVRLDMWQGTLEYYVNRKPQGISFYNLRCHSELYPMVSATATGIVMKLTYAASWRASLFVDAAKILAASLTNKVRDRIPPGLRFPLKSYFWLTMPTDGKVVKEDNPKPGAYKDLAYGIRRQLRMRPLKPRRPRRSGAPLLPFL
ncbi:SPRY domain-containing SOCS box protein 3-like [Leptidea sinapis]|uniref:SPRY domain-containing SOCS box protein 3-like n=1 Tax=Leptidea sinapis TaxID=189913 RepID=UPI002131B890|nr:SPRY domain-containing SOCS box protein 3-like [Leptidea sinapis]